MLRSHLDDVEEEKGRYIITHNYDIENTPSYSVCVGKLFAGDEENI